MVTAETAVVAPFVAAVVVGALWLSSLGVAQARANDAAREAARLVARGESQQAAVAAVSSAAAGESTIDVEVTGDRVRVVVRTPARLPLFGGIGARLTGTAVARLE